MPDAAFPKISVVMSVYNSAPYLRAAIDSILTQTFKDFEFIIVDNNSTDGSKTIIASYQDPRIVFIENQANLGQTKALNIGLKRARGEFIARMDADDVSLPQRLEKQYAFLSENANISVVGAQYVEITETGKVIRRFRLPTDPVEIKCYLLSSPELSYHSVPHPIVLMRRKALLDVGFYNEELVAQDYDLWVRLSRKYLFANLPDVLFQYRIASTAQSQRLRDVYAEENARAILENIEFYVPEWNRESKRILWEMLNFLPQSDSHSGLEALAKFDVFFDKVFAEFYPDPRLDRVKHKMKAFYLARILPRNPGAAMKGLSGIRYPFLLDKKFYAKVIKAIEKERSQATIKFDSVGLKRHALAGTK